MKRTFVLTLALLVAPALVSAQGVEIGLDAGFAISNPAEPEGFDGSLDNTNAFSLPISAARVGFWAGDVLLIESMLGFDWISQDDESVSSLVLMPGINYLLGEQFYVRGEAGLNRVSFSFDSQSDSQTQY
ncbi:MAG TPA: hypothetical protein VLA09_09280, partial [Longimicrobiales bacterium]|nr:hypothetical protein [Longimicrobiales bacterium]